METQQVVSEDKKMSAIERALAAAKARKSTRSPEDAEDATPSTEAAPKKSAIDKAARAAAKAAAAAELAAARAARKAEREARKAAKEAAAATAKKPAHMKKVERARAKCPPLSTEAEKTFGEITVNFSAAQIDALAQHLMVHNRAMATARATASPPLPMGATVRITGGEAKFIGAVGTVVHSQRLRAKVEVAGLKRPVYIYNGQAEVVAAEAPAAAVG